MCDKGGIKKSNVSVIMVCPFIIVKVSVTIILLDLLSCVLVLCLGLNGHAFPVIINNALGFINRTCLGALLGMDEFFV